MRLILILSILLSALLAQEHAFAFKEKKGVFVFFTRTDTAAKQPLSTTGKKEHTYYKNGAVSEMTRYVTDDRIQIAFSGTVDIAAFEKKYALKRIVTLRKNIYVFENHSTLDDVELCSQLWEEKNIEYARPLFKSKKRLQ